jgi:integrase
MLGAAGKIGTSDYERARATDMVLLLRHTGLQISDVALLERSRVQNGEILLDTHKTGAMVRLPIASVLEDTLSRLPIPRGANPEDCRFYFINGTGSVRTAISIVERCLRAVFRKSGVVGTHAHRFRHTLATVILSSGGTMRDVADILGISQAIAAKYYALVGPEPPRSHHEPDALNSVGHKTGT